MARQKQETVYRPMLWRALSTAWNHKELWPFALLAGLAGSGVIINDLMQQAQLALAPQNSIGAIFGGDLGVFIQRYVGLVLSSGDTNIAATIIGAVAVLLGGGFLVILCQQLLLVALHRAVHKKTKLTGRELLQSLWHHHYLRILGVDLLFHVLIYLVLGGGGTLMRTLSFSDQATGTLSVLIAAATLFIAFVLNILSMLTLVAVGEERVTILTGFLEGVDRFLRHPLVACETALLVFATNLCLTIAYLFGLAIIAIPFGFLFAEAVEKGTLLSIVFVAFFSALAAVIFTILAAGFVTTFTYSMWILLTEQLDRAPFGSRFHHHIRRRFTRTNRPT